VVPSEAIVSFIWQNWVIQRTVMPSDLLASHICPYLRAILGLDHKWVAGVQMGVALTAFDKGLAWALMPDRQTVTGLK